MDAERLETLLKHKIYVWREKKRGTFLTLCQKRVLDGRIISSRIDLDAYRKVSFNIEEAVYRFATVDVADKLCLQCKKVKVGFISIYKGWHTFCCRSCSSKYNAENGVSHIGKSGWKHTEQTKKKMSLNHADFSGDKNPFKKKIDSCEDFREEMRENKRRYWENLSKERRKEISEIFSRGQANSVKKTRTRIKTTNAGIIIHAK